MSALLEGCNPPSKQKRSSARHGAARTHARIALQTKAYPVHPHTRRAGIHRPNGDDNINTNSSNGCRRKTGGAGRCAVSLPSLSPPPTRNRRPHFCLAPKIYTLPAPTPMQAPVKGWAISTGGGNGRGAGGQAGGRGLTPLQHISIHTFFTTKHVTPLVLRPLPPPLHPIRRHLHLETHEGDTESTPCIFARAQRAQFTHTSPEVMAHHVRTKTMGGKG